MRLSPFTVTWDCTDSDPRPVFSHAVRELDKRELAFLELVESGFADAVSLGRPYISTPDVVERYRAGVALNENSDPLTWYGGSDEGYCDLPAMA